MGVGSIPSDTQVIEDINKQKKTGTPGQLGKDDFLKLLVTQLQYQDPMNPMEDKEFIAQMAQFTSLEQMQNMNASMMASQATSMIGKKITWEEADGNFYSGTVTSVMILDGEANLMIGDVAIALKKVVKIEDVKPADPDKPEDPDKPDVTPEEKPGEGKSK